MDGLTIRNGQTLLDKAKTASEIRADQFAPRVSSSQSASEVRPSVNGKIDGGSFANVLKDAISETNALQKTADTQMQNLATGKTTNTTEVLMSVEKADIALRLMTQVRNKIIEAYNDIMKMQV